MQHYASVEKTLDQISKTTSNDLPVSTKPTDIRQRLREWEAEQEANNQILSTLPSEWEPGQVGNVVESDTTNFKVDPIDNKSDIDNTVFNGEDLVDVGTGRVFLLPGDLVEIACVVSAPQLVIY